MQEKMFKNYVNFVHLLFVAYDTIQGLYEIYMFSFQISCYAFRAFIMTRIINQQMHTIYIFTHKYYIKTLKTAKCFEPCGTIIMEHYIN